MSRTLTPAAITALMANTTSEVFLSFLTIDPSGTPIRLVNDMVDQEFGGDTFTAYPFTLTLPDEDGEQISSVRIQLDNVDQSLVSTIRSLTSPPDVELRIVLASDLSNVEAGPWTFQLGAVRYDSQKITAILTYEPLLHQTWPQHIMSPTLFPGLYNAT